jgi:hypothetical protein
MDSKISKIGENMETKNIHCGTKDELIKFFEGYEFKDRSVLFNEGDKALLPDQTIESIIDNAINNMPPVTLFPYLEVTKSKYEHALEPPTIDMKIQTEFIFVRENKQ